MLTYLHVCVYVRARVRVRTGIGMAWLVGQDGTPGMCEAKPLHDDMALQWGWLATAEV